MICFYYRVLPSVKIGYEYSQGKMVGRKVLDGLRKGTKDVYALNVQYVKRYRLAYGLLWTSPSQRLSLSANKRMKIDPPL